MTRSRPTCAGWVTPAAAINSPSACSVPAWKLATRWALSGTTMARWRHLFCVATPVGHLSVWQDCDCTQPTANMNPRAALHQSAPSDNVRAMSKAVTTRPLAPSFTRPRKPAPTRQLCANVRPSRRG